MKKSVKCLAVVFGLSLWTSSLWALDFGKAGIFGAGILAGTYWHELGHASFGAAGGVPVEEIGLFETKFQIKDASLEHLRALALGGYVFQTVASEVIIENKDWHRNDFALGWLGVSTWMSIANPIEFYLLNDKNSDLGKFEEFGGNPAIPAALMFAHGAWTLYRILNHSGIPTYISNDMLGLSIKF